MRAMILEEQCPLWEESLLLEEIPIPSAGENEILVRIEACGVCRTDLHLIEGDLPPAPLPMVPGHEIVGRVDKMGPGSSRYKIGDRVGIAWLRSTCGTCEFCRNGRENLCPKSLYTGYHHFGGYAEYATVSEEYAYAIPDVFTSVEAAPLLCAGIIGYRAYKQANVPSRAKVGMIGFGSSAHITLQIALYYGAEVFVASRDAKHRDLAKKMGAAWVGTAEKPFPEELDSVIVFAPAGNVVPIALQSLKKGGTVSLAGISMSDIPQMNYRDCLFHEKHLVSVEANTRADGEELMQLAAEIPIRPHTVTYPLEQANQALLDLKNDRIQGTAVLITSS